MVMGLLALSSSLYYAGRVKPDALYTPKITDVPLPQYRHILLPAATITFLATLIIAARYLPLEALLFMAITCGYVALYTWQAGKNRFWFVKNIYVAMIAVSCVLMASVYATNTAWPLTSKLLFAVFSLYFVHGSLNRIAEARGNPDLADMPLKMNSDDPPLYVGIGGANRITAVALFIALGILLWCVSYIDSTILRSGSMGFFIFGLLTMVLMALGYKRLSLGLPAITLGTWVMSLHILTIRAYGIA